MSPFHPTVVRGFCERENGNCQSRKASAGVEVGTTRTSLQVERMDSVS